MSYSNINSCADADRFWNNFKINFETPNPVEIDSIIDDPIINRAIRHSKFVRSTLALAIATRGDIIAPWSRWKDQVQYWGRNEVFEYLRNYPNGTISGFYETTQNLPIDPTKESIDAYYRVRYPLSYTGNGDMVHKFDGGKCISIATVLEVFVERLFLSKLDPQYGNDKLLASLSWKHYE